MNTKEILLHKILGLKTSPWLLEKYWRGRQIRKSVNCGNIDMERLCAGAVRLEVKLMRSIGQYQDEMHRMTAQAAAQGVQLLAFPENNTFQLLGLIPGIEKLSAQIREQPKGNNPGGRNSAPNFTAADLFRFAGPYFNRAASHTFANLSRRYGIHIMAGSSLVEENGRVFNRASLFGPDGGLLGTQDKVHLTPLEHQWGLSAGSTFQVFDTQLGRLAMPVCMDASYFETFRVLEKMGAQIIMVPIANPEEYNPWLALRGIWPRVQESPAYGLKSALTGDFLGYRLTGKAGIFAPLELTPEKNGILALTKESQGEDLVTAHLNLAALAELKNNHPYLGDKNLALQRKYFPIIYNKTC